MVNVYLHFLELGKKASGIYNAGFENLSILKIANLVTEFVPVKIEVTKSNDPRSYRLNSDKLLETGFKPKYGVVYAIREIIGNFQTGKLKDEDNCYNIRTMKKLIDLQ